LNIPLTFLCEQLGVKAPESNLDIVDVRMLVPGEVAFEPGILYVGAGLDSSVSSSKNAPANEYAFEVLGLDAGHPAKTLGVTSDRPDEVAELASAHPIETVELAGAAAVLHTAGDSSTMLNRVLALMSRVRAWEDEVTSILLDKGGMNGVMHLFSRFMGNAAYLVDSSFRVIAIDDDPALSEMSAIWRHIRNYGFVPLDIITGMRRSGELGDLDSSREPTLFKSSYFNNEFVNANVWRGDRLWAISSSLAMRRRSRRATCSCPRNYATSSRVSSRTTWAMLHRVGATTRTSSSTYSTGH